jgi:hypothetical protein
VRALKSDNSIQDDSEACLSHLQEQRVRGPVPLHQTHTSAGGTDS